MELSENNKANDPNQEIDLTQKREFEQYIQSFLDIVDNVSPTFTLYDVYLFIGTELFIKKNYSSKLIKQKLPVIRKYVQEYVFTSKNFVNIGNVNNTENNDEFVPLEQTEQRDLKALSELDKFTGFLNDSNDIHIFDESQFTEIEKNTIFRYISGSF